MSGAVKDVAGNRVEMAPGLLIDADVYCLLTWEWYVQPASGCEYEWRKTRDEDHWAEWTCSKCGGRGRADVWD